MMSDRIPVVNSSDRDCTHEEVAAAHEQRAVLLEMCLKMQQAAAGETKSAAAAEAETQPAETQPQERVRYRYPPITKTKGNFTLRAVEGEITDSQIIVVLGKQGTGKSKLLRMLGRTLKPVESSDGEIPKLPKISYKYQTRFLKCPIPPTLTVRDVLNGKIPDSCMNPKFVDYVMEPLHINLLMDKAMKDLSPGELHTVALCICLGKPADIYLIDTPSTFLSNHQRITTSRVLKYFIRREKKAAIFVEHDFMMASYLADRFIVTEGQQFIDSTASAPGSVLAGANLYLSQLDLSMLLPVSMKLESTESRDLKAARSSYYRGEIFVFLIDQKAAVISEMTSKRFADA